jgi:hypothetical protein
MKNILTVHDVLQQGQTLNKATLDKLSQEEILGYESLIKKSETIFILLARDPETKEAHYGFTLNGKDLPKILMAINSNHKDMLIYTVDDGEGNQLMVNEAYLGSFYDYLLSCPVTSSIYDIFPGFGKMADSLALTPITEETLDVWEFAFEEGLRKHKPSLEAYYPDCEKFLKGIEKYYNFDEETPSEDSEEKKAFEAWAKENFPDEMM